jgi:hypothetical protein
MIQIIFDALLSGASKVNNQKVEKHEDEERKNYKNSKNIKLPIRNGINDFSLLLLGEINNVTMKIVAGNVKEFGLDSEYNNTNTSEPDGTLNTSEVMTDNANKLENTTSDNELTILGIVLGSSKNGIKSNVDAYEEEKILPREDGSGHYFDESSGEYEDIESNIEDIESMDDKVWSQIDNWKDNISLDGKENHLNGTTFDNVLGTTAKSNKQYITENGHFDILSIILGDVHNTRNATLKHKIKHDKMILKGNNVKVMMFDNVKQKDFTVKEKPNIKEVRNIDVKNVITGMKKLNTSTNNELDSSLFKLLLVDSILQTDKRLSDNTRIQEFNGNGHRDYFTSSQRPNCEKCITLKLSNNDTTDDRDLQLLSGNKHDILGGGMDESGNNKNKNTTYPYYPITYYPP